MTKIFSTTDSLGSFDFITNLIEIKKYTKSAKEVLESALAEPAASKWSEYWPIKENFKSLVVHEATHFIDCTTTTWGMELINRKLRLMTKIANGDCTNQPLSVFFINISELHSHGELVEIGSSDLSKTTSMTHSVEIHDRFGPIIYINYNFNQEVLQRVPLSLLAVLEANAYSNEILSKIRANETLEHSQDKLDHAQKIQEDFKRLLSDKNQTEYTVLLNLAKLHYPELTLKELLIFVSTLCRFTLDLNDFACSLLSNHIERSINNREAGQTICQDMRRGSSRAVIFFKTLLFIHGWMKCSNYSTRTHILRLLRSSPARAIEKFWTFITESFPRAAHLSDELIFKTSLKAIIDSPLEIDKKIIEESSLHNRHLINKNPLALHDFADLKMIDIFLEDGTKIKAPNSITLDIQEYFDTNIDIFSSTEIACKKESVAKFFMRPGDPIEYVDMTSHE